MSFQNSLGGACAWETQPTDAWLPSVCLGNAGPACLVPRDDTQDDNKLVPQEAGVMDMYLA